jgi:hypothetical protein
MSGFGGQEMVEFLLKREMESERSPISALRPTSSVAQRAFTKYPDIRSLIPRAVLDEVFGNTTPLRHGDSLIVSVFGEPVSEVQAILRTTVYLTCLGVVASMEDPVL